MSHSESRSILLTAMAEGILLPVQGKPASKRNAILGIHAGQLKVAVTQAPEKGKANDAIREILAIGLNLKPAQVQLHSGATSSAKKFLITGIEADELIARIHQSISVS